MPECTVIIPTVDRDTLQEAVDSVPAWCELLVERGGTTAENINNGLRKANGKYIKVLSDDDILVDFSCQLDLMDGYDFMCGNAIEFGGRDQVYYSQVQDLDGLLRKNTLHGATMLYRRDILLDVGGYDEGLLIAEEYDLHLLLLFKGYRLGYIDEVVCKYRVHETQKSDNQMSKYERLQIITAIKSRYR